MLERLTVGARRAVVEAQRAARVAGSERVEAIHLLTGLVKVAGDAGEAIQAAGLRHEAIEVQLDATLPDGGPPPPMGPEEERGLRRQLRAQGIPAARAELLVQRVQTQRAYGPVEVSPAVERVIAEAARRSEAAGVRELLRCLMASPPPDVDAAVRAAGTSVREVRRHLGQHLGR